MCKHINSYPPTTLSSDRNSFPGQKEAYNQENGRVILGAAAFEMDLKGCIGLDALASERVKRNVTRQMSPV